MKLFNKNKPLEGFANIEETTLEGGLLALPGTLCVVLSVGQYNIPFLRPKIEMYNPTPSEREVMKRNRCLDTLVQSKHNGSLVEVDGEVTPRRIGNIDTSHYRGTIIVDSKPAYHFDINLGNSMNEFEFLAID